MFSEIGNMWFEILKVLGTKSGYAQLDFDNIVEEEDDNDDNCYRRLQKVANAIRDLAKKEINGNTDFTEYDTATIPYISRRINGISWFFDYYIQEGLDEEIYCAIIDAIKSGERQISNDIIFFRRGDMDYGEEIYNYFVAEDPDAISNKYIEFSLIIRTLPEDSVYWSKEEPDNYASYRFKVEGKDTNVDDYLDEFKNLVEKV